jgi:hypothetical protein
MQREKVLGVVLNRAEIEVDEGAYYYRYRYYQHDKTLSEVESKKFDDREKEVATVS